MFRYKAGQLATATNAKLATLLRILDPDISLLGPLNEGKKRRCGCEAPKSTGGGHQVRLRARSRLRDYISGSCHPFSLYKCQKAFELRHMHPRMM